MKRMIYVHDLPGMSRFVLGTAIAAGGPGSMRYIAGIKDDHVFLPMWMRRYPSLRNAVLWHEFQHIRLRRKWQDGWRGNMLNHALDWGDLFALPFRVLVYRRRERHREFRSGVLAAFGRDTLVALGDEEAVKEYDETFK